MAYASTGQLRFKLPALAPGESPRLVFGRQDVAVIQDATVDVDARFPGLRASGTLFLGVGALLHGRLPGLRASVTAVYDANVSRSDTHRLHSAWQNGQPRAAAVATRWQSPVPAHTAALARWQAGLPVAGGIVTSWQDNEAVRATLRAAWQEADDLRALLVTHWQENDPRRAHLGLQWQEGIRVAAGPQVRWQETLHHRATGIFRWQEGQRVAQNLAELAGAGTPMHRGLALRWQDARKPPIGTSEFIVVPPEPHRCYDPATVAELLFGRPWDGGARLLFICGDGNGGVDPELPGQVVVPIRSYYVTINSIALRRIDGNIQLPARTFSMSLDADSWTWAWNASLDASALASIEPASSGLPVEIEALVNGVAYRLVIESRSRDRQFGQTRINVRGRGRAAVLDAPYAPTLNFDNTAGDRTAQQLMADVLTINGVGIGWSVDWQLVDWPVTAGAWSHQGSYISALNAIASAAGGYLQPHRTAATLRVLPRYPTAPWEWASVTPNFELPAAALEVEGVEWVTKPAYNRVHVSGVGVGVLGQVTRSGSAGDKNAPMVTDALITHADAARQRGTTVLADTGRQRNVSLKLQVLEETGIIVPGQFVRRTDGASSLLGIVRSTSLEWGFPKMRQTIGLQVHD